MAPSQWARLTELGIPRHKSKLLRQLCVADAIAKSEAIWAWLVSEIELKLKCSAYGQSAQLERLLTIHWRIFL